MHIIRTKPVLMWTQTLSAVFREEMIEIGIVRFIKQKECHKITISAKPLAFAPFSRILAFVD